MGDLAAGGSSLVAAEPYLVRKRRPRVPRKKIVGLYIAPPEGSTVICLEEKGPGAAKLYPAKGQWAEAGHRPHYQPDPGRRGYRWLFGALNPHSGEGFLFYGKGRDSANFTAFMDQVDRWLPEGAIHVVIDNLSIHDSVATLLWNFGHPRFYFHFLATGAAWLNLIEGWWRIIGQRALAGRNFQDTEGWEQAFDVALAGWNEKPRPFRWGPQQQQGRRRGKCQRCARLHRNSRYTPVFNG
jgi:transposase